MNKYKQGTLERVKTAKGLTWYLRYTDTIGAKTVRPRVRIGLVSEYPTKTKARQAAEPILRGLNAPVERRKTFGDLIDAYTSSAKMPTRHSTRRGYMSMLSHHIRPKWGTTPIVDVYADKVDEWLTCLPIGQRRKGHILNVMRILFKHARYIRWYTDQNPLHDFSIEGGTKRAKQPGTLTHKQFHLILEKINDPCRTMVIAAQCLGLRVSELFALKWEDVDFLGARLNVRRAIVEGHVGAVKTYQSGRELPMHALVYQALQLYRNGSDFTGPGNYVFASPWQAGELPYNASKIQSKILRQAGKDIGLDFSLGWHTFRHTYRALLRQSGAPMDVQRDLMRHADIQTTMQTYGGTQLDELRPINSTVVDSLFGERKQ